MGKKGSFTTKYQCYYLVWYEQTKYVLNAIDREKEIIRWTRKQKTELITDTNPEWVFYYETIVGNWPSTEEEILTIREKWPAKRSLKSAKNYRRRYRVLESSSIASW
jgi:hypothetical protein